MRLLPRQELTNLKQQEDERRVKEATSLGKSVDELRKLEQEERKKLTDFREREFAKFKAEEEKRVQKLLALDAQIAEKDKELESKFGPLDHQWARFKQVEKRRIEDEQLRQDAESAKLVAHDKELQDREKNLDLRSIELEQKRLNIVSYEELTRKKRAEAETEAASLIANARKLHESSEQELKEAQKERDESKSRLHSIELRSQELDAREKALEERETAVLIAELKYYSPIKQNNVLSNS